MPDFTIKEAASELRVGQDWLYQRTSRGELPHQRYGRSIRFTPAQIEQIRVQFAQQVVTPRRLRRAS
jgi:excisionase family DNA binding protein